MAQADQVEAELVEALTDELDEPSHSPQVLEEAATDFLVVVVVDEPSHSDQVGSAVVVVVLDHSDQVGSAEVVVVVVEDHSDQESSRL